MMRERYIIERHTEDLRFCFRIRDTKTGEYHGCGLVYNHAEELVRLFNERDKRKRDLL